MNRILDVIQTRTGTVLKDSRLARIEAFVTSLQSKGVNLAELAATLNQQPLSEPLWQEIIWQITVGETYFFRNAMHFQAMQKTVLPQLIESRRRSGRYTLRLWVAGCATGEEAYSLAMLLDDLLPDRSRWSIFLLATDINHAFLQFAHQGIYREKAFRSETPPEVKQRYFIPDDKSYRVKPAIQQMVTFAPLNLIEDTYPSLQNNTAALDMIFCRNVTIYFDRPTTQAIVNRFFEALVPGGMLLVGHSEPQPQVYERFSAHNINKATFYQKPLQTTAAIPAAPPAAPAPIVQAPAAPAATPAAEPVAAVSLLVLANQAADDEDWDTALSLLNEAEPTERFNPMLHYLRGLVFTHLDEVDSAIRAFRQAAYCDPDFALAHYAIGELLLRAGNRGQAALSWQRARKSLCALDPDTPVIGTDDLTAGMLCELLDYRLSAQ